MWTRYKAMFQSAIRGILMHKLRSFLTILGLVFGVASVIVMLAVAEGASQQAQQQIAALGINNIIARSIKPSDTQQEVDFDSFELSYGLTYGDLRRIEEALPNVVSVTPLREVSQQVRHGANAMEARIVGVHPSYFLSNKIEIALGRPIEEIDMEQRTNVCVIGEEVAQRIFPGKSPIGKSIGVAQANFFQIVGVQKFKTPSAGAGSSLSAQNLNRDVVIPLTTDRSRIGDVIHREEQGNFSAERLEISQITVTVASREQVKATSAALDALLAKFHPRRDYAITVPLDLLEQAQATQRIFNIVLGATAAISLLVGGIGIMNIMLATISERTNEIGIRRALGARQTDIIVQFLVETATLSMLGTILGVMLGVLAPQMVTYFSGMETVITPASIFIAAGVSFSIGIIFGLYPARKAAMLDPIEALRRA